MHLRAARSRLFWSAVTTAKTKVYELLFYSYRINKEVMGLTS